MAHFAELDESDIVTQVVVVANDVITVDGVESEAAGVAFLSSLYGHNRFVQTSYSGKIRQNYAGIGYRYDRLLDAFVPPQPFASWTLDLETARWVPPTRYPDDGVYAWHELARTWVPIST